MLARSQPTPRIALIVAFALCLGVTTAVAKSTTTTTRASFDDSGDNFSYFYSSTSNEGETDLAYALVDPGHPNLDLISVRDGRTTVERVISNSRSPLMWFRRDGRSYIVTDPALVAEGRELCEPMVWLGQTQGMVGKSQGDVGSEKSRRARALDELAEQLGELSLQSVKARRMGKDVSALREQRRAIQDKRRDVLKDQAYLARKGEFLGEKQRHLGAKQSELIKQIGQAVERLFEDAREQGKAQPIQRR